MLQSRIDYLPTFFPNCPMAYLPLNSDVFSNRPTRAEQRSFHANDAPTCNVSFTKTP